MLCVRGHDVSAPPAQPHLASSRPARYSGPFPPFTAPSNEPHGSPLSHHVAVGAGHPDDLHRVVRKGQHQRCAQQRWGGGAMMVRPTTTLLVSC